MITLMTETGAGMLIQNHELLHAVIAEAKVISQIQKLIVSRVELTAYGTPTDPTRSLRTNRQMV